MEASGLGCNVAAWEFVIPVSTVPNYTYTMLDKEARGLYGKFRGRGLGLGVWGWGFGFMVMV